MSVWLPTFFKNNLFWVPQKKENHTGLEQPKIFIFILGELSKLSAFSKLKKNTVMIYIITVLSTAPRIIMCHWSC